MNSMGQAFAAAWQLIAGFDAELAQVVGLSLQVSLTAVLIATLIGLPVGAMIAVERFRGRPVNVRALAVSGATTPGSTGATP